MNEKVQSNAEAKHDVARKLREDQLRKNSLRGPDRTPAPSSAHVVMEAKEWYQKFAKFTLFGLVGVSISTALIAISLVVVTSRPPVTLSYLMDGDGRVVRMDSIRNPSLTEAEVLNWAAKRIKDIHTLTFTDYVDHIQSLRDDFTPEAYDNYQYALLNSKNLEKVKRDRLMMWAVPTSAPRITQAKVVDGKFTWVVEMDLDQFMGGGSFITSASPIKGIMVVERVSRARNLSGVVVSKYLAKEQGL